MDEPKLAVHVFGRMQPGGAELRTLTVMERLDPSRWRFEFVALSGLPGRLDERVRSLGGEVHPVRLSLGFSLRFLRLLRQRAPDVVHSHVHHASGLLLRLASRAGVPRRIAHFRSTGAEGQESWLRSLRRRWLKRWIDVHATDILAVSEGAMVSSWNADWESDSRCRVLYSGLDTTRFEGPREPAQVRAELGLPEGSTLFCHVGSFRPAKNQERLAGIFAAILARDPNGRLLLVGAEDDEIAPALERRLVELGIDSAVRFVGERSDVARLLLASDAMIHPAVREGLPGVVLEACAADLPVVASALPGVREIAAWFPRVTTLSLDAPDEAWAAAALSAAAAPRQKGFSAEDAFRRTPFHLDKSVSALLEVYERPIRDSVATRSREPRAAASGGR